jgi:hypothetical protein
MEVSLELLIGQENLEQWFELQTDNGASPGDILLDL